MYAHELLAKLRCLQLFGYEDGGYLWIGSDSQWGQVDVECEDILRTHYPV